MSIIFTSAEDAEEAFYDAIGRGDLEALMAVWADDDEIICIHPTGQRLAGASAIRESWRTILTNNPRLNVRIRSSVRWKSVMLEVHSVIEALVLGNEPARSPLLATNVYSRGAQGWRLLSRHVSAGSDSDATQNEQALMNSERDRLHTLH